MGSNKKKLHMSANYLLWLGQKNVEKKNENK